MQNRKKSFLYLHVETLERPNIKKKNPLYMYSVGLEQSPAPSFGEVVVVGGVIDVSSTTSLLVPLFSVRQIYL